MTHPILSMLPGEARASHFEEELAAESRRLVIEEKKGEIITLYSLALDLHELEQSRELKATRRK